MNRPTLVNHSLLIAALASLASITGASGCSVFFPSEQQELSGELGLGADGGTCTKDPQTIQDVMLRPPICNATAPCPCGTFCSSQTGGNCVADCVDDTWCAPGYTCSGYGQCLNATTGGSGADGGTTSSTDPACPRNAALLDSLTTAPRSCQFDDGCPYGSFCNHVKETCDFTCRADSDCAAMSTPGHTFVCGCLGQCAEVAAPRTPAASTLPRLEVTPTTFVFAPPTPITTPNWGDTNARQINVVMVSPFITTMTSGPMAGAPSGPSATIRATPGPGLLVQCPTASSPSAMPCSFAIGPQTYTKTNGVYRTGPMTLIVKPSSGAPTATSWTLRLESTDLANTPIAVDLHYGDSTIAVPTAPSTTVTTLDPNFAGRGVVQIKTWTGGVVKVPVTARVFDGALTFFDPTGQLSPSGKLMLVVPSTASVTGWQAYIDASADSDVPLQDKVAGGLLQKVASLQIKQDAAGNLAGTYNYVTYTSNPAPFLFSGNSLADNPWDAVTTSTFAVDKVDPSTVGICGSNADCSGGAVCDLGFCTTGTLFHAGAATSTPSRPGVFHFSHKRMDSWGPHFGGATDSSGWKGLYAPGSYWLTVANGVYLTPPLGPVSGEPVAQLLPASLGVNNLRLLAVPLITQNDGPGTGSSGATLLRNCLAELGRDRSQPLASGAPDSDTYDSYSTCINLGRIAVALNDQTTFQRALQEWLDVHSFVMREGLEENLLDEVTSVDGATPDDTSAGPPPALDQLLSTGESGLAMVLGIVGQNGFFTQSFLPGTGPNIWNNVDYRPAKMDQSCSSDANCNAGSSRLSACVSNVCQVLTLNDLPHHEQPVGVPPVLLEATTAYLKVLEAYLGRVARETYGSPADNSPSSARQAALTRYGLAMRLVMAIEQVAVGFNVVAGPCPTSTSTAPSWNPLNCNVVTQRYNTARDEMNVARQRVIQQVEGLRAGANPFAIPEDDTPLFFGDPTGDNSRYFAASDYLIDGWAAPAVAEAQTTLDSARSAWLAQQQAIVQDELNTHARQQEIDQLNSKYGSPILAACGDVQVPDGSGGIRLLDSTEIIPYFSNPANVFSNQTCYLDMACTGSGPQAGLQSLRTRINSGYLDTNGNLVGGNDPQNPTTTLADFTVRSEVCKISYFNSWLPNDTFSTEMGQVCPRDLVTPGDTIHQSCSVSKLADGNLYFSALPSTGSFVPLAALYGPIRKADTGPNGFYQFAAGPGQPYGTPFATGPDDDIYSFHDYSSDSFVLVPKYYNFNNLSLPLKQDWVQFATPKCSDGQGHLPQDYPLPSASTFPASCYMGALGVAFHEMQANVDRLERAKEVLDAGKKGVDDTFTQCSHIDSQNVQITQALNTYQSLKQDYELLSGFAGAAEKGISTGNIYAGIATAFVSFGFSAVDKAVQDAADSLQLFETLFSNDQKAEACWNSFRAQTRALAAATTDVQIASKELDVQGVAFQNLQSSNSLNLKEGVAAYLREVASPVKSLAHHFWVDEKVERFKKEFEWSRRLTFIAMRAVEYEFQQSLPYRSAIVSATAPAQLDDVVRGLKQEQAARTINRRRPEESSIVVSLRDDVLSISDQSDAPAGERAWTPAQRFSSRLWDQSFAFRDSKGNYLGQGVPFTLGPTGVLETRCGERLWRATATLQGDGIESTAPNAQVLLLKRNTFSSQYCAGKAPTTTANGTTTSPTMQVGAIHTSAQLFEPGASVDLSDAEEYAAALLTPWFNIRRTDFYKTSYQDGSSEELAGRGLYGDYVLLFPKQMLDDQFALDRVEDVLLRLDYLSVDNLSQ
jgi:hypothetical protein